MDGEFVDGTGNYQIYCYFDRESQGRPLVLIHSINAAPSAIELKPLFQHFRLSRPVVAPDLPGFGRSTRSVGQFTPSDFAREISILLEQMNSDEAPDVVVLSLWAASLWLGPSLRRGARVRSLTLISPSGFSARPVPAPATQKRLKRVFDFAGLGRNAFKLLRLERSIRYFYGMNFSGFVPNELISYALKTTRAARCA